MGDGRLCLVTCPATANINQTCNKEKKTWNSVWSSSANHCKLRRDCEACIKSDFLTVYECSGARRPPCCQREICAVCLASTPCSIPSFAGSFRRPQRVVDHHTYQRHLSTSQDHQKHREETHFNPNMNVHIPLSNPNTGI